MNICVVGLGYVELPLAIQFARANVTVIGLDIDAGKVDSINQGRSYIRHIAQATIEDVVKEERLCASTDFSRVKEGEAVVICVPTPLYKNREPDISFISRDWPDDRTAFNKRDTGGLGIDHLPGGPSCDLGRDGATSN